MKTRWPLAALAHRWKQLPSQPDRRLEVDPSARPISSCAEVVEPARARQARVGDEDVDVAGLLEQASAPRPPRRGRRRSSRWPLAGQAEPPARRARRPCASSGSPSPRARRGHRDRPPEAAGRPGEQRGLASELHGANLSTGASARARQYGLRPMRRIAVLGATVVVMVAGGRRAPQRDCARGRGGAAPGPERLRLDRRRRRRHRLAAPDRPDRRSSSTSTTGPSASTSRATTESPAAGRADRPRLLRRPRRSPATATYDAWWGVGYAVAQDRLFQLELFRRATSGRLAEILGSATSTTT